MTMTKAEIARRYRAKCKREGRCTECGKPLGDCIYTTCDSCRNKHKEIVKRSREYYRRIGICPYCHKEHLYNGERMCIECKAKKYAWFATHKRVRRSDTESKRRLRAEREKEGLCVSIVILKPYQAKDFVNTTTKRFVSNLPKSGREVMPTGNNKTI